MSRRRLLGALVLAATACSDGTPELSLSEPQAEFETRKRAWLPGERDSVIQRIVTNREWVFPYAGDISDLAPQVYADPDSYVVMVPNPAFAATARRSGLPEVRLFDGTFTVQGIDLLLVNATSVPRDSTHWIGVLWYNGTEPTWKGFILAARPGTATTVPQTNIRTGNFDAGGGKSGAGGGEYRLTTLQYWEANGSANPPPNTNSITISSSSYGAAQTVTTGPFLGGTTQSGTMLGRIRTTVLTLTLGSPPPSLDTVDVNFSVTAIPSVKLVCDFPTPCTTNVPVIDGALRAGVSADSVARLLPWGRRDVPGIPVPR
jgi:hypothetical protein